MNRKATGDDEAPLPDNPRKRMNYGRVPQAAADVSSPAGKSGRHFKNSQGDLCDADSRESNGSEFSNVERDYSCSNDGPPKRGTKRKLSPMQNSSTGVQEPKTSATAARVESYEPAVTTSPEWKSRVGSKVIDMTHVTDTPEPVKQMPPQAMHHPAVSASPADFVATSTARPHAGIRGSSNSAPQEPRIQVFSKSTNIPPPSSDMESSQVPGLHQAERKLPSIEEEVLEEEEVTTPNVKVSEEEEVATSHEKISEEVVISGASSPPRSSQNPEPSIDVQSCEGPPALQESKRDTQSEDVISKDQKEDEAEKLSATSPLRSPQDSDSIVDVQSCESPSALQESESDALSKDEEMPDDEEVGTSSASSSSQVSEAFIESETSTSSPSQEYEFSTRSKESSPQAPQPLYLSDSSSDDNEDSASDSKLRSDDNEDSASDSRPRRSSRQSRPPSRMTPEASFSPKRQRRKKARLLPDSYYGLDTPDGDWSDYAEAERKNSMKMSDPIQYKAREPKGRLRRGQAVLYAEDATTAQEPVSTTTWCLGAKERVKDLYKKRQSMDETIDFLADWTAQLKSRRRANRNACCAPGATDKLLLDCLEDDMQLTLPVSMASDRDACEKVYRNQKAPASLRNTTPLKKRTSSNRPVLRNFVLPNPDILTSLEMELAWLAEESIYCLKAPSWDWTFTWIHASPALKAKLDEAEYVRPAVSHEFHQTRSYMSRALHAGYRRPHMKDIIDHHFAIVAQQEAAAAASSPSHTSSPASRTRARTSPRTESN